MILSVYNISKSFGTDTILSDVTFLINEHEKAALVGINGAGKTTLLKIIAGLMKPDSGDVTFAKGSTFGYLAQHRDIESEKTVYDEMLHVREDILQNEEALRRLEAEMNTKTGDELEKLLASYTRITAEFEREDGYAYKSRVVGILKGLGFGEEDFERHINSLSGGERTRLSLGRLLLQNPDLILLDEPTNHLDIESVTWLESYLLSYKGAVLIVSHDRYFMDKTVTKVIELENAAARTFEGNYSAYAAKKEQLREIELKHYLNQQEEIKRQEAIIEKLRSFNREKSIKRAESREKLLAKTERLAKPVVIDSEMKIHLTPCIESGGDVMTVTGLAKAFGENRLFDDVNFEIKRGERLAILGSNGTGKTTLLKIINGDLTADAGDIRTGTNVYIGYYDQEQQKLSPEKTVYEELEDDYPLMTVTEIRSTLAAFLFTGDDCFKQVKELSGGERGRVSLAKLMLSEANLLILDEPTNHLDIVSKEVLEKALVSYSGTVLFVSHDRYFVNTVATGVLDLTHGRIVRYNGGYDYYLEKRDETNARLFGSTESTAAFSGFGTKRGSNAGNAGPAVNTDQKTDYLKRREEQARERKRRNDLTKTEKEINDLEAENAAIDEQIQDPSVAADHHKLMELNDKKAAIEKRLEELMEIWEELMD